MNNDMTIYYKPASCYLKIIKGPDKGRVVPLFKNCEYIIGKSRDCNVLINKDDPYTSRKHASISIKNNTFILKNMSKSNGTFVNGQQIDKIEIVKGDQFQTGKTHFILESCHHQNKFELNKKIFIIGVCVFFILLLFIKIIFFRQNPTDQNIQYEPTEKQTIEYELAKTQDEFPAQNQFQNQLDSSNLKTQDEFLAQNQFQNQLDSSNLKTQDEFLAQNQFQNQLDSSNLKTQDEFLAQNQFQNQLDSSNLKTQDEFPAQNQFQNQLDSSNLKTQDEFPAQNQFQNQLYSSSLKTQDEFPAQNQLKLNSVEKKNFRDFSETNNNLNNCKQAEDAYLQGKIYYNYEQIETAISFFKQALSVCPDHQYAKIWLNKSYKYINEKINEYMQSGLFHKRMLRFNKAKIDFSNANKLCQLFENNTNQNCSSVIKQLEQL